MKRLTLILLLFLTAAGVKSQEKSAANALIEEGIKLHDAQKYPEAIAKYKEALQLEPDNPSANYELAFTLFANHAANDAIPYLNKVVALKSNVQAGAYDMLGSIYDDQKQPEKAIEYFQLGIKANPGYQRIYYNLALTYTRMGKGGDAIPYLVKALKLNPSHSSSHKLLAAILKTDPANNIIALMAYCNFLMLEPTTARSAEAYKDVQSILNSGISKTDKTDEITISNAKDADINAANIAISFSVTTSAAQPGLSETEKLEAQLKSIFSTVGALSEKKQNKDFFWIFYADYFYKLSKTEFMPLIARIVNFTANKEENAKWISEHKELLAALGEWGKNNPRNLN